MRLGLGVLLCVASCVGCGQAERNPSRSGGGGLGGSGGDGDGGDRSGAPARGGNTTASAGAGSPGAAGAAAATSGAAGTLSSGGTGGDVAGTGGQSSSHGGDGPVAGAGGNASDDDYLYCGCDCCTASAVLDAMTCYFPDVAGDLERVKADEAAKRAQGQCTGENCGYSVPYRACRAAAPDAEPAEYSNMPYVGGINRVYVTKQVGDQCTRLELTNEHTTRLRTALETAGNWRVTSALFSPCSGQTEHGAIGVSGSLEASGGRDACLLDLHVTAFFVDRKTGTDIVKVRFDIDDMPLVNVPLGCPD